jgi:hypothetical protein
MKKLTLIILNYNSKFWLKKCLQSLQEHYLNQTATPINTVVVDNHSQDDSVEMIKHDFPWVKLIEQPSNGGFAQGNNAALKEVDTEYVMLLNSDIEFTTRTNLDLLISFMDSNPQAGIVTPQVTLPDGGLDWASHRGEPTLSTAIFYYFGLEKRFPNSKFFSQYHQTYLDLTSTHQIDACSGAAMLIRTKYMNQVGLLDERFFMYAEDLDWCKRFREAGYEIWFIPEVQLIHHKYKSGIKTQSPLTALQARNHFYNTMLLYYDKHYLSQYPRFVRTLLRMFVFIKKGGM